MYVCDLRFDDDDYNGDNMSPLTKQNKAKQEAKLLSLIGNYVNYCCLWSQIVFYHLFAL